jgi:hypothetical protein
VNARRHFRLPLDFGEGPRLTRSPPQRKPPAPLWAIALAEREAAPNSRTGSELAEPPRRPLASCEARKNCRDDGASADMAGDG